MTLKQFFQVAGGALVSLLIYSTGLYPIIKWPLIIFSFSTGLALAFLPFEERPLGQWIFSFFRSIYSPTVHVWKEPVQKYSFFKENPVETKSQNEKNDNVIAPHGEAELETYLKENPSIKDKATESLEQKEKTFLQKVTSLFSFPNGTKPIKNEVQDEQKSVPQKPREVSIPQANPVSVAPQQGERPKIIIEERKIVKDEPIKKSIKELERVDPTLKEQKKDVPGAAAQFSVNAAPPLPPSIPNTVVGQVMDTKGKIIDGAILEIRDMAGRPVRALRSNKAGHFIIVTALQNGFYEIIPEKEGFEFEPVSFETKGEIIPPIAIRAKKEEKK